MPFYTQSNFLRVFAGRAVYKVVIKLVKRKFKKKL